MDKKPQKYILLNASNVECFENTQRRKNADPVQLFRGELCDALPDAQQPEDPKKVALVVTRTKQNVLLKCPLSDVSRLTESEADLLAAVAAKEERFRIHWQGNSVRRFLNVGSNVFVKLRFKPEEYSGIIRYKGKLPRNNGTWFGVELIGKEANRNGENDGTYRGTQYFECPRGCGVFVTLDKLRPQQEVVGDCSLKVNQRVVAYLEDQQEARGVVRYIAETQDHMGNIAVGIELDEKLGRGTGSFEGKKRFDCEKDFAVFLPLTSVILEKDFDETENSKQVADEIEIRLRTPKQKVDALEKALALESQAHEEAEKGLHGSKQKVLDLENALTAERLAHQEINKRLKELEASLTEEKEARQETEMSLYRSEQRSQELEASLTEEKEARQETERRLYRSEQRSEELEATLTVEKEARQETERRFYRSEKRSEELEASLTEESQYQEKTVKLSKLLNRTKQEIEQLEKCLALKRNVRPDCDWVLFRNEILLSEKEIGRGAYGQVLEGIFRGCKVAVKRVHDLILSPHNTMLFEREMSIASRCRHPCLLQFIGATDDKQSPLFVTELLDTSLRSVLHDRALETTEITNIASDVAKGLNYLHLHRPDPIIHRDISSPNVLLWKHGTSWRAKVSDYGTANFLKQSRTVSPGTRIYSAPEVHTTTHSPKVDVFSFGILLCEMNTREQPDVNNRNRQIEMVINTFFQDLIRRCSKRNPEERPCMDKIIEILGNYEI